VGVSDVATQTIEEDLQVPTYRSTFRHYRGKALVRKQLVAHVILPVAAALLAYGTGIEVRYVAQIMGGIAILTGFLFTLIVFIFQLRASVSQRDDLSTFTSLKRLIDELFSIINHAIGVSLALVAWLLWLSSTMVEDSDPLPVLVSSGLVLLTAHLVGVLWTIANRTRSAYRQVL
jgi:F0F1-type ATP synthase assembly protein I